MTGRFLTLFSYVLLTFHYDSHAQKCISDSGQTVPFTLSQGATSAWDQQNVTTRQSVIVYPKTELSVHQNSDGLFFTLAGNARSNVQIALFSIDGKCSGTFTLKEKSGGLFNRSFPAGLYLVKYKTESNIVRTVRFIVER